MDYSSTLLMTSSTLLTISSNFLITSSDLLITSSDLLAIIVGSCLLIRVLVTSVTSRRRCLRCCQTR